VFSNFGKYNGIFFQIDRGSTPRKAEREEERKGV
jgi:hypothetical protein